MAYIGNTPANVGNYQILDDGKLYTWNEDITNWTEIT